MEDDIDNSLQFIEDDILSILSLKRRKRKRYFNQARSRKKRGSYNKYIQYYTDPDTGVRTRLTPLHTVWYQSYILHPNPDCKRWQKLFRYRFRMPYESYVDLVNECDKSPIMGQWSRLPEFRYNKKKGTSLELLVLCALRWLGRGWTMDDLQENTQINIETIRQFLHHFIKWGSSTLYDKYVRHPMSNDELSDCGSEFMQAGLPGCVGSTDATHIVVERCPYKLRQLHMGYKLPHTARTYNLTCNHRRKILHTTCGHPSRFNDKTLISFDDFVQGLKNGIYNDKFEFELYDFDTDDQIIKVKYRGCYVIVDNGYLRWSVTVPPIKKTTLRNEIRFSDWLESMRKDVECTFGILKGRWRCLKYGLRMHSLFQSDAVWKTCCALHNMLLEVDGLVEGWNKGVTSEWESETDNTQDLPFALRRLIKPGTSRNLDLSGIGYGNDMQCSTDSIEDVLSDSIDINHNSKQRSTSQEETHICVNNISLHQFRSKLIRHFNIAFQLNSVKWPSRFNKDKKISCYLFINLFYLYLMHFTIYVHFLSITFECIS